MGLAAAVVVDPLGLFGGGVATSGGGLTGRLEAPAGSAVLSLLVDGAPVKGAL